MSVEEDIQRMQALQPKQEDQIRAALGLVPEALLAKVLQFETTEAFTEWRKHSDSAPPCVVFGEQVYFPLDQLRAWVPKQFEKQNPAPPPPPLPMPNTVTPPFPTGNATREEFIPPPQRRDYGKERLTPMDLDNNRYKTAQEEKERQRDEETREQSH